MIRLTKDHEEASKKLIELETKIEGLTKKNEKETTEVVNHYEGQVKKIEQAQKEQIKDTNIKVSELNENLEKNQDVGM